MNIEGIIEKIIYKNTDNGYTVLEMTSEGNSVVTVGILPLVAEGELISVEGDWITHASYGKQFSVSSFTSSLPKTETAILRYLSSGIVPGIRAKTARILVEAFGPETLEVMENDPLRVAQIKGITPAKAEKISQSMKETLGVKSILLYFQQFGITPTIAFKIYKQWGLSAYDIIKNNPYRLCRIPGLGFEKVDEIAEKMGCDRNDENRIQAAILYILEYNLYNGGHTFLPRQKLCMLAAQILSSKEPEITKNIQTLINEQLLIYKGKIGNTDGIYLSDIYASEKFIAERICLAARFSNEYDGDFEHDIRIIQHELGIDFTGNQKLAIKEVCRHKLSVLTGGPGTGKTTTLNGIIRVFEMKGISYALAAPTGRAAKRMSEVTGREAKTLHRLLEYKTQNGENIFLKSHKNQLEYNAVIVDESSMVDVLLLRALFDAMPITANLILVGDAAQLPPIGPGKAFKEIIESHKVPVITLNEIFRQAEQSLIVTNAHRIITGENPILNETKRDFFFLPAKSPDEQCKLIASLYANRLPNAYGYDPMTDIQVLSPTRKGATGTTALNVYLRQIINPIDHTKRETIFRGTIFREGDKVMQIRNNYDIIGEKPNGEAEEGVFNGDIGIIEEVDAKKEYIIVNYDDKKVTYTTETLEDLEPAYAVTVHKSQGSEFKAVILSLLEGADILFTRNLLYTAVTRARENLIIVGSAQRVFSMVKNTSKDKRFSGLKSLISEQPWI